MPGVNRSATDVLELSFQLADVIGDDDAFMCTAFEILERLLPSEGIYNEVAARVGVNHNITFLLRPFALASPRVDGWSFWRRHDFCDDELELARRLQPVLAALDVVRRRPPQPSGFADTAEETRLRTQLTIRELDVLELVAAGLTAAAVGRARRISTATVRKHLEHAYAKLGVSDRPLAVARARQLGLLPPIGESDRQPSELP